MNSHVDPYSNFNPNRCNKCFTQNNRTPHTETKVVCQNCKLIKYCSKEHQALDWNIHRDFCNAIISIIRATDAKHILDCAETILPNDGLGDRKQLLARKIDCSIFLVTKVLGRPLEYHERALLQQPAVCNLCTSLEDGSGKFVRCDECHQIAYCSKDHLMLDRAAHSKWCKEFGINFMLHDGLPTLNVLSKIPTLDENARKAFPEQDNYRLASNVLERNIHKQIFDSTRKNVQDQLAHLKIASFFSWVGTLLYTLTLTDMVDVLRDQLNVFIVGAQKESLFFNPTTCAAIFSYIPTLRRVRLFFIGPEVADDGNTVVCYEGGQRIEYVHYTYVYHELPKTCVLDHPNVIVAFNCGFNECIKAPTNSWPETIRLLLQFHNVPFAFTSYTMAEAIDDCSVVLRESDNLNGSTGDRPAFVKRAFVNPYRDLLPFRNPDITDEQDPVYYDNGYLSIAMAHKK